MRLKVQRYKVLDVGGGYIYWLYRCLLHARIGYGF